MSTTAENLTNTLSESLRQVHGVRQEPPLLLYFVAGETEEQKGPHVCSS